MSLERSSTDRARSRSRLLRWAMPGGAGAGLGRGFSVAFRRAKVNDDEEDDEYGEYEDEEEDEEEDEQGLDRCVSIFTKVVQSPESHTLLDSLSRVTSSSNNRTLLPVHLLQLDLTAVGCYNVRIVFVSVGASNRKTFLVFELMGFLLARIYHSRDESRVPSRSYLYD